MSDIPTGDSSKARAADRRADIRITNQVGVDREAAVITCEYCQLNKSARLVPGTTQHFAWCNRCMARVSWGIRWVPTAPMDQTKSFSRRERP